MIEDGTKEKKLKKDNAPVKRVELRAHTMMSQYLLKTYLKELKIMG